jgi:excisionase family DNA binding protein
MLKEISILRIGRSVRVTEQEIEKLFDRLSGSLKEHKISGWVEKKNIPAIYTAEEIAGILNLSVDNILLLLKSGELKGFKIRQGRSSWRVPEQCLDEFVKKRVAGTRIEEKING